MYKVGDKSVEVVLSNLTKLYQILGMEDEQIEIIMQAERKKQIEIYAYLIFHNKGMKRKEKKALILKMDSEQGKKLYRMNSRIYYKEKIGAVIKKGI